MAYKLFASGDVLTASDVNSYIMKQTVMVFTDSTARSTALSGVLTAGMVSYLTGTNSFETYNGSAWVANGTGTITTVAPVVTTTPLALATNYRVQFTPNAAVALTTTVPVAGAECTLVVVTSGATSYVLTFSTGFLSQGTLTTGTVTAKTFVLKYISNGTNLLEVSRTIAI